MGVWEPVLRKDMDAEGAQAVSLRWVGTDKGDADRPNHRSRLAVREIKKAMKKSDVPSAAELFSGMPPLESVKALLSLFVSHSQEEVKGKGTLACDISRAHFHEVLERRVFVELPDEEKERLPRESGLDLEYVGLLRKCMYGAVDASARRQGHHAQILKKHSFVQGLSNSSSFVCVEGDVRVVVHGDDVMVEMPTHEEKWFEIVLFSKYDGKCTGNFHSDVIAAMGASFLNRVIMWDPTSGWRPTRGTFQWCFEIWDWRSHLQLWWTPLAGATSWSNRV